MFRFATTDRRHTALSERRRLLLKAADVLEARTPEFVATMAAEVGASGLWAGFNVFLAANVFREAASLGTQIQGETIPTDKLGGNSPLVALDDANVDEAVKAAVFGSFLYPGQICMSTERIVVDVAVADEFVAKFAARAQELPAGDPATNVVCVIGPMVAKESGARLNRLVDDAPARGAKLATGGRANGALMPAKIVDHVKPGMKIYDEETFGPITTVVRVRAVDEAVSVANDTAYGLSSGVFGRDVTRAPAIALQIDCGAVQVDGATVQNEVRAPCGGMKDSGYGRFDGRAVIDEFTELKWITLEPSVQEYPV